MAIRPYEQAHARRILMRLPWLTGKQTWRRWQLLRRIAGRRGYGSDRAWDADDWGGPSGLWALSLSNEEQEMLFLLEGNIAAGKTTLGAALSVGGQFVFVAEPVERWQGGFAANLLERFYADTPRWAFTLQICAFVTRTQAVQGALRPLGDIVFERSIYCDRHVFARSLHQQGLMDDTEWALYCHFWDHFRESAPSPDAILYLRTPAEECYRRLQARGRREEKGVSLDYLRQLEACHDAWLRDPAVAECPVLELDGTRSWTAGEVRGELERMVVWREGR